jgi:LysR family transcriptional activator of dmlA
LELYDRLVDLVEEGFQLDIRIGRVHESNVIARRIACNRRVLCAAPAYLARFGTPAALDDLHTHRCIPIRERDQDFGRWELDGPEGRVAIKVSGPLSANNGEIVRQWAIDGHGIILRSTWDICDEIDTGVARYQYCPGISSRPMSGRSIPHACRCRPRSRCAWSFLEAWFAQTGMNDTP